MSAETKTVPAWRKLALGAALLTAAYLAIFGDKTPAGTVDVAPRAGSAAANSERAPVSRVMPAVPARAPNESPALNAAGRTTAAPSGKPNPVLDELIPRTELLPARSASAKTTRDLFAGVDWTPPPPPPVKETPPPPAPPTAPPLPFQIMGKRQDGGQWEVFLNRGDQVLIVRKGSVVEDSYRIDDISPPSMTVTYLPLRQTLSLSVGEAR
ncbi:hypothetical protein [Roseateles amylovorans]|uniref:Prolin-rich transmembrane protein n=1 Tax=Roseateles amylovorans TaxID=2978473 RepID=A0ABY6AUL6_9BURK|nr:hypothetical protein [Roseateles amylovorans]UXH76059.1 hypothetical protein N4261_13340 [Roseateles amylovorans]